MVDDSRTNKFTWEKDDLVKMEIFFVWYEPPLKVWVWAQKKTPADNDAEGVMSSQFNVIEKEFLGIPVSELRDGAYDQDGNRIPNDDPILSA